MSSYHNAVKTVTLEQQLQMMENWRHTLQIDHEAMAEDLAVAYTDLLRELHKEQVSIPFALLGFFSQRSNELIVLLMNNTKLLATAQASLMFPALVATVHISNVVVHPKLRGKGYGEKVMNGVMHHAEEKWRDHWPFKFSLTSQEKRSTGPFYQNLGFVPTPTIRYTK